MAAVIRKMCNPRRWMGFTFLGTEALFVSTSLDYAGIRVIRQVEKVDPKGSTLNHFQEAFQDSDFAATS